MESIIAGQKVARRRPIPIAGPARKSGLADILRSRDRPAREAPRADFMFVDGGIGRRPAPGAGFRRPSLPGRPLAGRERRPVEERARGRSAGGGAPAILAPSPSAGRRAAKRVAGLRPTLARLSAAIGGVLRSLRVSAPSAFRGLAVRLRQAVPAKVLPLIVGGLLILALAGAGLVALAKGPAFPLPKGGLIPDDGAAADLLLSYALPEAPVDEDEELSKAPAPPATLEISTYTVRTGDSIASIAKRFRLAPDTLISINGIKSAKAVKNGAALKVPNMDGLVYRVRPGDSLGSIAKAYRTDTTRLADANDLSSSVLMPGQSVFIPGARLPASELRKIFGELVAWPIRGPISSYFGYRPNPFTGLRQFHAGLDIVANTGFPIKAAIDGKVADVGYNALYGNYVILNHEDGLQTLYGHMSATAAKVGQRVGQGTVIGLVGSTGYSTGPHLHFGLFRSGAAVNPLKYLK